MKQKIDKFVMTPVLINGGRVVCYDTSPNKEWIEATANQLTELNIPHEIYYLLVPESHFAYGKGKRVAPPRFSRAIEKYQDSIITKYRVLSHVPFKKTV